MRRAALLLAALLLTGCSPVEPGPPEPPEPVPVPVPAGLDTGCPDPSTPLRFPEGDLPPGATKVRLCPGEPPVDGEGTPMEPGVQGPPDLLTTGVARLVPLVDDVEDVEGELECTFDAGPDLVYWFGYPDGDWRAVRYGAYGCHTVQVGTALRLGGERLANTFTDALVAQRAEQRPPGTRRRAGCGAPGAVALTALAVEDLGLATATWCVSPGPWRVRGASIPRPLVERLDTHLWPGSPGLTVRGRCTAVNARWIVGYSPWGDKVGYSVGRCSELNVMHGIRLADQHEGHLVPPGLVRRLTALDLGPVRDWRRDG